MVDRLCHAHFDKTIIKNEWTPLLKDLNSAVAVRNSIAHWEANFILDVSVLEPWESPIALTPHHLDVRAQADKGRNDEYAKSNSRGIPCSRKSAAALRCPSLFRQSAARNKSSATIAAIP